MTETETKPAIFQLSAETVRLIRKLEDIPQGETITYREIGSLIGIDPQSTRGRNIVRTAIKHAQHQDLAVFKCVQGVGFRHLTDEEIPDAGSDIVRKIGKQARRGSHLTTCAEPSKLSPAKRIQQLCLQTRFAVMAGAASAKAEKRITSAVEQHQKVLDCAAATIEMFK